MVCGDDGSEDGKTYMNDCLAACDNIIIKCDGACPCQEARVKPKNEEPICKCPRTIMSVCGENNKTYWNECLARCDETEVQCGGRCPCPQRVQPRTEAPSPTMDPGLRDLWRRLLDYITNMWGTPRSETVTGTVKMV